MFLHPGLAVAAACAATLPVMLHLLLRRPRATPWPSTMLLRRAMERMRRRHRIERWLLLALRAAGIGLVGLAMAGPLAVNWSGDRGGREWWIVIDDGATGAERLSDGSCMLDLLKKQALQAMDGMGPGDRVALVTTAQPASVLMQPTADITHARGVINALQVRPVQGDLRGAVERCLAASTDTELREALVLTGWRRGSVDPERPLPTAWMDRARTVRWTANRAPVATSGNHSIQGVRVGRSVNELRGTGEVPVRVQMQRVGSTPARDTLTVRNGANDPLGQAIVTWTEPSRDAQVDVLVRPSNDGGLHVECTPDTQPLDDSMAVVMPPTNQPKVVVVGRRSSEQDLLQLSASMWITHALESTGMQPQEIDPASLALRPPVDAEAVILCRPDLLDGSGWAWLGQFVRDGGTLILLPPPEQGTTGWTQDLERAVGVQPIKDATIINATMRLAARQPRSALFSLLGAELDALAEPVGVQRRIQLVPATSGDVACLSFDQGEPAMLMQHPHEALGVVVTLAFSPEVAWTDLPLKPFMVPLFQETVRAGRALAASQRDAISGEVAWLGSTARNGLLVPAEAGRSTIEIDGEGRTRTAVPAPGLWKVKQRDGRERWVAVRLEPSAASVEALDEASVDAWRSGVGSWRIFGDAADPSSDRGGVDSPWTMPLLAIALACLVAESALARVGSPHESRAEGTVTT